MTEDNPDRALLRRFNGSPLPFDTNPLGIALKAKILSLDAASGRIRLAFHPGPEFIQGHGVVQGGIVATMLDFAAALAVLSRLAESQTAVTATLTVSFMSAVRVGPLVATGIVERSGRRMAFARAEIQREGEQEILATASEVMTILERR
jgi:uncharacterized protein (TIGR00369 family)